MLDKSLIITTERTCAECDTQYEILEFDRSYKHLPELFNLYCPKCKSGCGLIESNTVINEMILSQITLRGKGNE